MEPHEQSFFVALTDAPVGFGGHRSPICDIAHHAVPATRRQLAKIAETFAKKAPRLVGLRGASTRPGRKDGRCGQSLASLETRLTKRCDGCHRANNKGDPKAEYREAND